VNRRWVVNSSPLIALAKVGGILHLVGLAEQLVVPSSVAREVRDGGEVDPARVWLESEGAPCIVDVAALHPLVVSWDLGRGESEVLFYAHTHQGFEAIVDDRAARNCARILGVPFRGTVGVVLLAKREGRLESVKRTISRLQGAGLRLDGRLIRKALELSGE